MADLSVAHRAALAQVIENVPDRTLRQLALAVGGMPGERARTLEAMLTEATLDRARRARGMAALAPMFRARPDEVGSLRFPPQVLPRLWKIVAAGQTDLLAYLDPPRDYQDDSHRVATVCTRLFAAAAAAVRDQADAVWPSSLGDGGLREARLDALAAACDLGGLAHRALPSLQTWIGRPNPDQVAELRLLLRDATAISTDGTQQLLEILFAHIADAPLILRLVANSSKAAGHGSFLSGSELAIFVDRLVDAAEVRAARIGKYRAGEPVEPLRADLQWISDLLSESEGTLPIQGDTTWGQRIRQLRLGVSAALGSQLGRVGKAVDKALPMARIQTAGRMTREIPQLGVSIDPATRSAAAAALDILKATRGLSGPFGCDAQRQALIVDIPAQLIAYADLAIEEINAGVVADEVLAGERVMMAADFLERIELVADARAVRRRVAVSGVPVHGASPRAA